MAAVGGLSDVQFSVRRPIDRWPMSLVSFVAQRLDPISGKVLTAIQELDVNAETIAQYEIVEMTRVLVNRLACEILAYSLPDY